MREQTELTPILKELRALFPLREGTNEDASNAEEPAEPERLPRNALERMEASFRFMKRRLEVDP
jgi:hypothetical protein